MGRELVDGRARMTDEEWVASGRSRTLDDYIASLRCKVGLDIST